MDPHKRRCSVIKESIEFEHICLDSNLKHLRWSCPERTVAVAVFSVVVPLISVRLEFSLLLFVVLAVSVLQAPKIKNACD